MKIGILTFQRAENYGAALQCRALYDYLLSTGNDVEIIDYRNPTIEMSYSIFPQYRKNPIKYATSLLYTCLKYREKTSRKKKYFDFISQMKLSESLSGDAIIHTGLKGYGLIISGSDQLWNPEITGGLDKIYFLQFPGNFVRASYAVSLGSSFHNPHFQGVELRKYLEAFGFLSVRETEAVDFISSKTGLPVSLTIDPTLLHSADYWEEMIFSIRWRLPKKYIFMYNVKRPDDLSKMAEHLSEKLNMPVVHINLGRMPDRQNLLKCRTIILTDVGPLDFVYLVKNAGAVLTSSFHGAAFSCIFQKDAYLYSPGEKGDSRLESLTRTFGITNRVFRSYHDFLARQNDGNDSIAYAADAFFKLQEESKEYLQKAIKEARERI